jgi:transcriptional regulator GlxA family with amidase domain
LRGRRLRVAQLARFDDHLWQLQFVQRIRVETARYLLETTRLSIEEIARQVGYAEPSTLRRLIRRDTKQSRGYFRRGAYATSAVGTATFHH